MHGMIHVGPPPPSSLEKKRARRKMDESEDTLTSVLESKQSKI
jgi:hypothetical protein